MIEQLTIFGTAEPIQPVHTRAKLSAQQVLEIRDRVSEGKSYYSIAKRFGVTAQTVSYIANRKIWKNV